MTHHRRKGSKRPAQPSEVIQQVARITHNLEGDIVEIAVYDSADNIYLYETLWRSQPFSNAPGAEKPAPLHRRVTLCKTQELWAALRCAPGQEALVLTQDLKGVTPLSDLLELLMAAECPYILENSSMSKAL